MAGWTGLEPAASAVTGQRSNQLNYHPPEGNCKLQIADVAIDRVVTTRSRSSSIPTAMLVGGKGLEPLTAGV